jgi:serine/threonine-protein kinase
MSPEQLRGDPLDGRSDLFAVGIMLYEVLTGGHPFYANTILEIATKIMRSPAPSIRRARASLPAWADEIVQRALEKDPEKRFGSAAEMERAFLAHQAWRQTTSDDSTTNVAIAKLRTSSSTMPRVR